MSPLQADKYSNSGGCFSNVLVLFSTVFHQRMYFHGLYFESWSKVRISLCLPSKLTNLPTFRADTRICTNLPLLHCPSSWRNEKIYQFSFDNIYFSYLTNSSLGLSVCFNANCNCLCTFAQSLCLFVTCCGVINGSNSGWCSAETIYRGVHKSCQRGSINPRRKYVDTTLCWDINHKTRCHITASWRKH